MLKHSNMSLMYPRTNKKILVSLILFVFSFLSVSFVYAQYGELKSYSIIVDARELSFTVNEPLILAYSDTNGFKKVEGVFNNGSYKFTGLISEPKDAQIVFKKYMDSSTKYYKFFLLEPDCNYEMKTSDIYLSRVNFSGTLLHNANEMYKEQINTFIKEIRLKEEKLAIEQEKKMDDSLIKRIESDITNTYLKLYDFYAIYADSHIDNWMGLYAISDLVRPPYSRPDLASQLFERIPDNFKKTQYGIRLKERIDGLIITAIGKTAPDFAQPDMNGKMVWLSSFRGKFLLLDFWASWCIPCRKENPNLVKLYNRYDHNTFEILGISYDDESTKAAWVKAIKDDKLNWTHVSELKNPNSLVKLYHVQAVPYNILIDPNGKILGKNLSIEQIEILLNKKEVGQ
jgi:peroxiredoxin